MRKIRKEKPRKRSLLRFVYDPRLLTAVGMVILVAASIPLVRSLHQKHKVEQEINNIKKEVETLQTENKELDDLVEYLRSDHFVEERARLDLGLKERGEEVVVVKGEGKVAGASATADVDSTQEDKRSNPEKWIGYFFDQ